MIKKLLLFFILLLPFTLSAQRYAQYFTNTTYESLENPAQAIFKPDTSRRFSFNFFVPNVTAGAFVNGHATTAIKQNLFLGKSTYPNLTIGNNDFSTFGANVNVYLAMFKIFTGRPARQEIGFSIQVRGEGNSRFSDETVKLFDGSTSFENARIYNDLFNDNYYYQGYHQFSFQYRETLNKQFGVGFKLSALSGVAYEQTRITSSSVNFSDANTLILNLQGDRRASYLPGDFSAKNAIPTFKNPGLSLSLGVTQRTDDGVLLQYNLKDVGFIHWRGTANKYSFSSTETITGANTSQAGENLSNAANEIFQTNPEVRSFNTSTNGLAEVSATKYYWLDYGKQFKFNPVAVLSKEVFHKRLTGALINNLQYRNLSGSVITTFDDLRQLNLGGRQSQ